MDNENTLCWTLTIAAFLVLAFTRHLDCLAILLPAAILFALAVEGCEHRKTRLNTPAKKG